MSDALVVFTPSGRRGRFERGTSVLDAARRLGVDLDSVCGGRGICGRCQVTVAEGEHAKHGITCTAAALTPATATEQAYAADRGLAEGRRLGCTALVADDVVIDVPPESQVYRQVVRKEADARPIEVDPVVRLYYVEVEEPQLASPRSDLARLLDALEREWGLRDLAVDPGVLRRSATCSTKPARWRVTVAVHDGTVVTAIWPGFHDAAYGIAFDVGLDDGRRPPLRPPHRRRPRVRRGDEPADPLRRGPHEPRVVRDAQPRLGEGAHPGRPRLPREADGRAVPGRGRRARRTCSRSRSSGIPSCTTCSSGSTRPSSAALRSRSRSTRGSASTQRELGLPVNPGARAYVLPCIAGHVGADTAGVILAEAPHLSDEVSLVVDVGTNAEIVLGNRERLLAASSPTGPAFEGAQISCGQRAAPGAIERVRIDPETLEPRVRVVGCDAWSDEPGFRDVQVTGVCGSGIIEVVAELHLAGILTTDGTIDGSLAPQTPRIVADGRTFSYVLWAGEPELAITQNDIRQIQLAKAALHAGCRLLDGALRRSSRSTGSGSLERSARRSTPFTRSCSGWSPTATRSGVTLRRERGR